MIRKTILLFTLAAFALALPTVSFAAKGDKKKGGKGAAAAARGYDANSNGKIDGDERAAVQKAFEADKNGALKGLDTNADGKLDDAELDAIKAGGKKKGKK
jgi:hypothetical protein